MTRSFRIAPAGDAALLIVWDDVNDPDVPERTLAVASALKAAALPAVRDVVPTLRSVAVYFDPARTEGGDLESSIATLVEAAPASAVSVGATIDVPVCYGGAYGPDLDEVALRAGIEPQAVIALHAAPVYRVRMLGFAPGFAYLGDVDRRIAVPRHQQPRVRVAAGSVGIADQQTAIYPFDMPGGWRIVGRTPLRPCDVSRAEPFLFAPGDRVRFHAIDTVEFDRLSPGVRALS